MGVYTNTNIETCRKGQNSASNIRCSVTTIESQKLRKICVTFTSILHRVDSLYYDVI